MTGTGALWRLAPGPTCATQTVSSESYHEPFESLSTSTRDLHRALASLMEELEAVDWYQQRVDATSDAELAAVLAHNRDEEIEHAAMVLEWIRRRVPKLDEELRTYLYSAGSITEVESRATEDVAASATPAGAPGGASDGSGSLGIGSLRAGAAR